MVIAQLIHVPDSSGNLARHGQEVKGDGGARVYGAVEGNDDQDDGAGPEESVGSLL